MIRSGFIILDALLEWHSTGLCTREAVESPLTLESSTAIEIFRAKVQINSDPNARRTSSSASTL